MNFKGEIEYVLASCGLKSNENVVQQLYNTAFVESGVRNIRQYGGGPALGYFQCEPRTRKDILKNYMAYHKGMRDKIETAIGPLAMTDEEFMNNVPAQIVYAYLHYERFNAWEHDEYRMAVAWKNYYNTRYGKGTIKKYLETVNGRQKT